MTVTLPVPAMDDPAALRKLLGDCNLSSIMVEHVVGQGYTTIALIAHAVSDPTQVDEFVQHLSLVNAGEEYQPFSPQSAALRRAVKECMNVALDVGRTAAPGSLATCPSPHSADSCGGEGIEREAATDSRTLAWVPWKRRSSEHDEIEATEFRRPRNDKQLLKSILADGDIGMDELPEARVDTGGPVEIALSKFQCLLANALAMTGACHLLVIKKFHAKFLELAVAKPRDQHLRSPTIHEVMRSVQLGVVWRN
eukprot:s465_g9.t1